jgi:single-stranded-DNA-specific exonuclease
MQAAAADTFIDFGGHRASGGFSVQEDAIHSLEERLNTAYATMSMVELDEQEQADGELAISSATPQFLKILDRLAPFGMGNPKPTFVLREVLVDELSWFGKTGEHLRIRVSPVGLEFETKSIQGITFYAKRQLGKALDSLEKGKNTTLLVTLERDTFTRGQPVRLRIISIGG